MRLLDQYGGIVEYLHYDEATGTAAIQQVSDVESVIERNKYLQAHSDGYSQSREWQKVASIPLSVIEIWKKAHGADPLEKGNEDLLKRLLNDPALKFFRTTADKI